MQISENGKCFRYNLFSFKQQIRKKKNASLCISTQDLENYQGKESLVFKFEKGKKQSELSLIEGLKLALYSNLKNLSELSLIQVLIKTSIACTKNNWLNGETKRKLQYSTSVSTATLCFIPKKKKKKLLIL